MRTVREQLQRRINEVEESLRDLADVADRDQRWHDMVDEALHQRASLMTQRDLGFMITDRRRVRG